MRLHSLPMSCLLILCVIGCSSTTRRIETTVRSEPDGTTTVNRSESVDGAVIARLKTEWEGTYIEVSGWAPVTNKYPGEVERNRGVAQDGARLVAETELIKAVSAVRITQQQTMIDRVPTTRVESFVRGVAMPGAEVLEDGVVRGEAGERWQVKLRVAKTVLLTIIEESVRRR